MSKIEVDKVDPQSGTALEIGTSGDTVTVPSGVGLTLTDSTLLLPTTITSTTEVKTNKISPATGTAFALGDSGDTFTVPSGATIVNSGTATGFPETDLTPVNQDIITLALRQSVDNNSAKYNLPNGAVTQFESDADYDAAGSTDIARNAAEYISTYGTSTSTDYDQTLSTICANMTIFTGSWTNAITNDSFSSPAGTGGNYPGFYVNYIYDLATDWEIRIFEVTRATGNNDITEDYTVWNTLITSDTSVAAGADTASAVADGRVFRQTDFSAACSSIYRMDTGVEWGDNYLIASYASTIGVDSATANIADPGSGHQQLDCTALGASPYINSFYTSSTQNAYGWLVEYDRDANTITQRSATNAAWTTFAADKTTWTNVPATGRLLMCPGSGNGQQGRTTYYSTTYNGVLDADKGYVQTVTVTVPATGTALGTTNVPTAAVTSVSGVMLMKNAYGTNTLGTDVKVYFTADNSNWTEATSYTSAGTFSTGITQITLGQTTVTSGSDVRWKIVFANQSASSKEAYIYGMGLNY